MRRLNVNVNAESLSVSRTSPQTSSASSRSAVVRLAGFCTGGCALTVLQSCSSSLVLKKATLQ